MTIVKGQQRCQKSSNDRNDEYSFKNKIGLVGDKNASIKTTNENTFEYRWNVLDILSQ